MEENRGYNPKEIEKKWQEKWEASDLYKAVTGDSKPKWYSLFEFPYPSGQGLHIGHCRPTVAMDVISRKRRMEGYNVLYPIGWDAFGLPTENYAIKTSISPQQATKENTDNFTTQLKQLGMSFDWSREINTTDPGYYKWTQWMFKKFFEAGLAYKATITINWCPNCKAGLANEELENGRCDRCGGEVEQRPKSQWMLRITKYADRLLKNLDELDFLPQIKSSQANWIGRSEGAEIKFQISNSEFSVEVFTTRPDTIFGATYLVLAPEHAVIEDLKSQISNLEEIEAYIKKAKGKTDLERQGAIKDPSSHKATEGQGKTGVELKGVSALNPATGEQIPVWISDYVLASYGTGAIMAVPAHDERDFEFAKTFGLKVVKVIDGGESVGDVYSGAGKLINSGEFDGLESTEAAKKVTEKFGVAKVQYKLRDWVFSRQRYWGEPIPLVFCEHCADRIENKELGIKNEGEEMNAGWFAVSDEELPLVLPDVADYKPREDGESPLASVETWVNTTCPTCGGPAKRETDTMPNWAGSSWYFLRYMDAHNSDEFASKEALNYWGQVDWYNGGMEHVTLHLLYSRFWNMALFDLGLVSNEEPYKKRTAHGLILAEGGVKMSKSKGNVINPLEVADVYGADALRLYIMFMGPFDQAIAWDKNGILGTRRFLDKAVKIVSLAKAESEDDATMRLLTKTANKVSTDIEDMGFNTAIAAMMEFLNKVDASKMTKENAKIFVKILAPFAPHICEELWETLGGEGSVHAATWPEIDAALLVEDSFELVVQTNGKTRGTLSVAKGLSEEDARALVLESEIGKRYVVGEVKRIIFVKDKLINFIVL